MEAKTRKYYSVVLFDKPLDALTYCSNEDISVGVVVQVPVKRQSCTGIVVESSCERPNFDGKIRAILEIVDPKPLISPALMATLRFMSAYYASPLGFCLKLALPTGMMRSGTCRYLEGVPPEETDEKDKIKTNALFEEPKTNGLPLIELVYADIRESRDGLTETEIRKKHKVDDELFQSWVCCGALVPQWSLNKARLEESMEALYEPVLGVDHKKLGAKQQALLSFIEDAGEPVKHSVITEKFGSCVPVLKRLTELGLIKSSTVTRDKTSFDNIQPIVHEIERTDEQREAIEKVVSHQGFGSFLLFGVTGSGKTEVYLGVMEAVRARGQGCIFVLPEIALTPQFCAVFRGRFGDDVAVLHSNLSEHERFDTWSRIRAGRTGIAIGPRSALFAPVQNLGPIVIDEEHDSSFKQGETPRYHARDMAIYLARQCQCPVILGSATPSLESYGNALQGKSEMLMLTHRPLARPMPEISIVDMRNRPRPDFSDYPDMEADEKNRIIIRNRLLSDELIEAMRDTLSRKEQIIIFLNRRGFSNFVQCEYCGNVLYCPNCDVALTYYKYSNDLHCHYCDYVAHLDDVCSKCGRRDFNYAGYGTERLVDVFQEEFPSARIDRLDRDRATTLGIQKVLGAFRNGDLDILVGTQMIAKGHDIHNVTLVGIVNADMTLHLPDFRSAERTYQLLTQVSGRAGRGDRPGRVILQTLKPEHPAIQGIVERDYLSFARQELEVRRALDYPPFSYMIMMRFEGENPVDTEKFGVEMARIARHCEPDRESGRVLGPAPAPIPMLCGKLRYQLFLKHKDRQILHRWLLMILGMSAEYRSKHESHVRCSIDVDPYDML